MEVGFQFNLGNALYFMKLVNEDSLTWNQSTLNLKELNLKNAFPIYTNQQTFWEFVNAFMSRNKSALLISLIFICIGFFIWVIFNKRKKMPKEVVTYMYQNFFNSISIVEKELLEVLYQSNLKGEEVSTKIINKIIGVQHKDTLTQNKSRSDHFIKINQKFKMATQNTEPLVIKNRDKVDKRQYNYDLNNLYIMEIEKLLKG